MYAQKNFVENKGKENFQYLKAYQRSRALNDYETSITALYYLINSDSSKYSSWTDTLALLYLKNKSFKQAYLQSRKLLTGKGYTELRLRNKAESEKALGQNLEAEMDFTLLFNKTKNPYYGYNEMLQEYILNKSKEAVNTGSNIRIAIMQSKDSSKIEIESQKGTLQHISISAAVANLSGLAYLQLNDKNMAEAEFEAALQLEPNFEQAKNNLAVAEKLP